MYLTLMVLKQNLYLLSEVEELDYEPKVHLINPYLVSDDGEITKWPLHTEEEHIMIDSTNLLTAVQPTDELRDKYLKKVGKTIEQVVDKEPQPVLLSEGDELLEPIKFDDEFSDYEPYYLEE